MSSKIVVWLVRAWDGKDSDFKKSEQQFVNQSKREKLLELSETFSFLKNSEFVFLLRRNTVILPK